MNENPYQAPSTQQPIERRPAIDHRGEQSFNSLWDTFFWSFMGFAAGTLIVEQLLTAAAVHHRMTGSMMLGGAPLAIVGFVVAERRRRARTAPSSEGSSHLDDRQTRD